MAGGGKVTEREKEPDELIVAYRQYLATKPLDILTLYLQLRCTPLGADFPKEVFIRTPIGLIGRILQAAHDDEKRRANIGSISTAKLTQVVLSVAQAFGGSKEPNRTKISDFLPFELDAESSEVEERTKEILTKLVKSQRIPPHVIAALSPHITLG